MSGLGGVTLRANDDGVDGGDVILGLGTQPNPIEVGSRYGLTRVDGENVRLNAAANSSNNQHTQLGYYDIDPVTAISTTGPISVTATLAVVAQAGGGLFSYVQIGHGGAANYQTYQSSKGSFAGDIEVVAGSDIVFTGGFNDFTYAQIGNGGAFGDGTYGGNHTVYATNNITFTSGAIGQAYVHVGNGGLVLGPTTPVDLSGDMTLVAEHGNIAFIGGDGESAYLLVGNGGRQSQRINVTGNHKLHAGQDIIFTSANGWDGEAQVGNGGGDAYGSASGDLSLVAGRNVIFEAVPNSESHVSYALVGHGGPNFQINAGYPPTMTGKIEVIAQSGYISFTAAGEDGFAQVGHYLRTGNVEGSIQVTAALGISFFAGDGEDSHAMVGHNGIAVSGQGNLIGDISVTALGGDITFRGGSGDDDTFASIGHAGSDGGVMYGDITVTSNGDVKFTGGTGDQDGWTQIGHASMNALKVTAGHINLSAPYGNILFRAGGEASPAIIGHGGVYGGGRTEAGDINVLAGGEISLIAHGEDNAYAKIGHTTSSTPGLSTHITVTTLSGPIILQGGDARFHNFAKIGLGGYGNNAHLDGNVTVNAATDLLMAASSGDYSFVQVGTGGNNNATYITSTVTITAGGSISVSAGTEEGSLAHLGNGGPLVGGTIIGDVTVWAGKDLVLRGAHVGYLTNNSGSVDAGNTYIAVGQNDPRSTSTAVIWAENTPYFDVGFNSAPVANGGELRFYVPRAESVLIPADTPMNSELYPGNVPVDHMAGFYFFALGPYIQDYSFYIAPYSDVGVDKQIAPNSNLLPGQPVSYTLAFSNSGIYTASAVTLIDTLPTEFVVTGINHVLDVGTVVTQTDSAPNIAFEISPLAPGVGGEIYILGVVTNTLSADTTFTNTITITDTWDITPTNNRAIAVANVVVPRVQLSTVSASVNETAGVILITATLDTVNQYAAVSVQVATSDGTATAGSDYLTQSQTLTIPAGQTSSSIPVVILDDLVAEGDETFFVTLSGAVGASLGSISQATVTILDDDIPPSLLVSKVASVERARAGETIVYTYLITNSGGLTFTTIAATDDQLGTVTLNKSSLALGEVATGQLTYTVSASDVPGTLNNTVTVTGTPVVGSHVVVTASESVDLVAAAFAFTKTVGIKNIIPECTANTTMQVPISTTVVYCFTITNTGDEPLTLHTLQDDHLGTVLDNVAYTLEPGASYSITVTRTLYASITNTAVWIAGYAQSADTVSITALPVQSATQATVNISDDAADQDGDGIPDNIEQADDVDGDNVPNFLDLDSDGDGRPDSEECSSLPCQDSNGDGIPDFLDPNSPTNLPPGGQPGQNQRRIFLPAVAGG